MAAKNGPKKKSSIVRAKPDRTTLPGSESLPQHALAYLTARGVSRPLAQRAGIRYVASSERRALVSTQPAEDGTDDSDGLYIPFPEYGKEFTIRALDARVKEQKFKQPPKSKARPYFTPSFDWGSIRADAAFELSFCEGPVKALSLVAAKVPVIGLTGMYGWSRNKELIDELAKIEWHGRSVILVPDSDINQKVKVQQGWLKLGEVLAARGAAVSIRLIPNGEDEKKYGPDDFVTEFGVKAFRDLECVPIDDERFTEWGMPEIIAQMNQMHAAFVQGNQFKIYYDHSKVTGTKSYSLLEAHAFLLDYKNTRFDTGEVHPRTGAPIIKTRAEYWLEHSQRRRIYGLVFDPLRPWGLMEDKPLANIWRGFAFEPHKPDAAHSWSLLRTHIRDNICSGNEEHFRYVLGWMAFGVQKLNERPGVAIVLQGGEGIGKGSFAEAYVKLFGSSGLHIHDPKYLTGNFNGHLEDKIAIFADEAVFAGDHRVSRRLRGLITDESTVIEAKFRDAVAAINYTRLIVAGNDDLLIHVAQDARRYAVFHVSEKHKRDGEYFVRIKEQLRNGGYEAMLFDLLSMDISDFDVRDFPDTGALHQQKVLSLNSMEEWYMNMLANGWQGVQATPPSERKWQERVESSRLRQSFEEFSRGDRFALRGFDQRFKNLTLRYAEGVVTRTRDAQTLGDIRCRGYVFKNLEVVRAAFEKALGSPIDWDDASAASNVIPFEQKRSK